jgi:hypothetical protein
MDRLEQRREADRRRYAANREVICARKREQRKANPDKVKAIRRKYREANRDRINTQQRAWRDANPDKCRKYRDAQKENAQAQRRENSIGKGAAGHFAQQLAKQNELCAICSRPLDKGWHTHLDHNHVTGQFRGILCRFCNTGLGFFSDSVDTMQKAIDYLNMWSVKDNKLCINR